MPALAALAVHEWLAADDGTERDVTPENAPT